MNAKILIVDDEPALTRTLSPILCAQGYECQIASSAAEALRHARAAVYDVALLDLGLPDADGKEIIEKLISLHCRSIIVLSARLHESEKVAALDCGATDYLGKPFGLEELLARVRVALRRANKNKDAADRPPLAVGKFRIDFGTRQVTIGGREIKLSPTEYGILECLCQNAGQIVTRRQLMISVWNSPDDDQKLRVYMSHLRKKMRQVHKDDLILNEAGVGYRFVI